MTDLSLFFRFGVALVIGVLIGLQREHAFADPGKETFAGVRTFALLGLVGCAAALASDQLGSPWAFAAFALSLGALLVVTYYIDASQGAVGLTSEVSAMITFLTGALAYWDQPVLAAALGVLTAVLLSIKLETQKLVHNLTRADVLAVLKFAVITAIVLPLLPNRTFGPPPFDALNPRAIWWLVVLISGISFVGYALIKFLGARRGIGLLGLLGGLASSTAVTLSFTQRSQTDRELSRPFALAIIIAWTVMYSRLLVEVAVLNRLLVRGLWPPLLVLILVGLAYCGFLVWRQRPGEDPQELTFSNPFDLGQAIRFGLIFTLILLVSRAAQLYLGSLGIYLSSVVSGLADVDAVALSISSLARDPTQVSEELAVRAIVLAAVANTFAKGGIVLVAGSQPLRRAILPGFLLMLAAGLLVAFL